MVGGNRIWRVDEAVGAVTVSAQPHTDIFIDPGNGSADAGAGAALNAESMLNAVTLLGGVPDGDFQFSARVTVGFASTFDAGVLLLWLDERRWGSCASSSRRRASLWSSLSSAAASPTT